MKNDAKKSPYVLVHGAYHGGWCWHEVAKLLAPNVVYTPTLTGLAEDYSGSKSKINLERHIRDIVELIEAEDLQCVHLVGWSYGGMVITGVLAKIPARIVAVTYLDAYLPADNESASSFAPLIGKLLLGVASLFGVGVKPPDPRVRGIDDEKQHTVLQDKLTTQPARTLTQSVAAPEPWPNHVTYSYIWCQGYADSVFGQFYKKAKDDDRFRTTVLAASHAAVFTTPDEVARAISNE